MYYPEKAANMFGLVYDIVGIVLIVTLLIGGCIRKADDKDE